MARAAGEPPSSALTALPRGPVADAPLALRRRGRRGAPWEGAWLVRSALALATTAGCREPVRADDAATSAAPASAATAVVAAPLARGAELPAPRLRAALPEGDRLDPTDALELRFDADVDPARVSVETAPRVGVEARWPDARTLRVRAVPRWRSGRAVGVRVVHRASSGVETELWARQLWPRVPAPARVTPGEGGLAVLTFDDAPARRGQAERLLELLAAARARAILFPTGRWAAAHPDWVRRAVEGGHLVCNHSATHRNLTLPQLTDADVRREIAEGASDGRCRLFRPPLMALDERVLRVAGELGWAPYLWDVDTRDWEGAPAEDLVHRVLGRVFPGAVILLHQHGAHTLEALPALAERLRAAGYVLSWDVTDQTAAPGTAASATASVEAGAVPSGSAAAASPGVPVTAVGGDAGTPGAASASTGAVALLPPPRVAVPRARWAALLDPVRPRAAVVGSAAPTGPVGADADEPVVSAPDQPPPESPP